MRARAAAPAPSPRLLVRTLVATFAAIAVVLAAVFVMLLMDTQARVTRAVVANLDAGRRAFSTLERRRQDDLVLQAATLAESPTLKAALDTYQSERRFGHGSDDVLRSTVGHEVGKLAARVRVDAIVVLDRDARIVASGGPHMSAWPAAGVVQAVDAAADATARVVVQAGRPYRVVGVPLTLDGELIGAVMLATSLDATYAREVADLSRARTAIVLDGHVIASTLDGPVARALDASAGRLPEQGVLPLAGEQHAVGRLFRAGTAEVYAVDSIDAAAAGARRDALETLAQIGLGALGLGAAASLWLARTLARPINGLSRELKVMAATRAFTRRLPPSGSSEELDALADTFNELMASLRAAEEQTELAYLGAIKALAAALDARDPYTAGHSERVSALSVMLGEQLGLDAAQLEVLRLGALLHDIGKIGIRDKVLTKNGPLTDEEHEIIKTHPTVGAHILRQVPMLAAHLPIVELHHERPDGRGYPYGLVGPATPPLARIVHVADAFDAMTSARAYRPAQSTDFAIDELCRHRGSQFDPDVVDAFLAAWAARHQRQRESVLAAFADTADEQYPAAFPRAVGR